jgi:hypothetical protein
MGDESTIKRARPSVYLYRAGAAHVRSHASRSTPTAAARALFGNDIVTDVVLRTASTQATLGSLSWAGALGQAAVDDSIMAIATFSAGAELIQRGMKVDFAGRASLRIPGRVLDANDAGTWIGEGGAITMRNQRMTAGPTLTPHKLVVLTSYTREMAEHSAIEAVSRALISEATALKLDATLFGTQADDGVTPGGLLNGATQVTGVATGGGATAMATDISKLVGALVTAYGGRDVVLVMNPAQATSIKVLAGPKFDLPVLPSSSVPAGTVIAIEASSFVSAFGAAPEFETVTQPIFHYDDTAPANPIMTGVPVRSLFQTDSIALRMTLRAAWGMRTATPNPVHVAYMASVSW